MATSDRVYLLDVIQLQHVLNAAGWQRMATALFCDDSNLTLGQTNTTLPVNPEKIVSGSLSWKTRETFQLAVLAWGCMGWFQRGY